MFYINAPISSLALRIHWLLGDPPNRYHPTAWMGNLIAWFMRFRQTLDQHYPRKSVIMLLCALEDKDISGILEELKPRLKIVVATRANHPRAPSAQWTAEQVKKAGIPGEAVTSVADALERALELTGKRKIVLSVGSVVFAGEVSAAWQNKVKPKIRRTHLARANHIGVPEVEKISIGTLHGFDQTTDYRLAYWHHDLNA